MNPERRPAVPCANDKTVLTIITEKAIKNLLKLLLLLAVNANLVLF